jgi:SAM-dependent methyltransferase
MAGAKHQARRTVHQSVCLPARYHEAWKAPFRGEVTRRLRSGITVLDIGGGRHPVLAPAERPDGVRYVGLDLDARELEAAGEGAYDVSIAGDATARIPELAGAIDLAVSWQVFEHVPSLEAVLRNIRDYLKPGGALVSLFSGRWAAFALVNRLIPENVGVPIARRVGRGKGTNKPVFQAYYDSCSYTAVTELLGGWTEARVIPLYHGATYFGFAPVLMRVYLAYENAIRRLRWRNGATHYLLIAER